MARAIAMCKCEKCGKEFQKIQYLENRKRADEWQKWAEANITICEECYKEEREAERKVANEEAAKENAELGLPALIGSEKQIAWAEKIRNEYVKVATAIAAKMEEAYQEAKARGWEQAEEVKEKLDRVYSAFRKAFFAEESAKAWIDARSDSAFGYEIEFCKKWYAEYKKEFSE